MTSNDLFKIINDFTTVYRAGAGLPPLESIPKLKNPPEPEVLNGRDEDYTDVDDYEPDYLDEDERLDDPIHGQAEGLNKLR